MLKGFDTDLRFAFRLLKRQPLMSVVGFVSLGAGLALNILLLTLADAALLRPLPLRSPHDLVVLLLQRESGLMHNFSYPDYRDLRASTQGLDELVAYAGVQATMASTDGASPLEGEVVSGNFFDGLGVPMRAGRTLGAADDRPASPPVAVISEQLWRERLGAAPLSAQVIHLNGEPHTVVGVAASQFAGMQVGTRASFWVPLAHSRVLTGEDFLASPSVSWLTVVGRLRSGVAQEAAREELDAILLRVRQASGREVEPVVLRPGSRGDSMLSEQLASPMLLLMAAGALVLLIACLNVANLQAARTEARRLELAVRAALGASRLQLVRLVVLDGVLMAAGAGIAGMALAVLAKDRAASLIAFYGQPVSLAIPVDLRVLAGAVLLSLAAAAIIGMLSTLQVLRRQKTGALADIRSSTVSYRSPQRAFVVLQVALSMGIVTGAALMVRTLDRLRHADLGFDARGAAVVQVSPEMARMSPAQSLAYFDDVIRAARAMPGVEAAGVAHVMPLGFGGSRMSVEVAGFTPAAGEDMELNFIRVSPGYFSTLGVPILQGRAFDDRDRAEQPERIIVNETMARRFWPDGQAIGRFVRFDRRAPFNVEVVGVVPDLRYRMVREDPHPSFYVPLAQMPSAAGVVHVRFGSAAGGSARPDATSRVNELRRIIAAVNPAVPITRAHSLSDQLERNIADERMATAIGFTLAVVVLLLATAGLYATMAFLVGRRTREIGVRMALGARTSDVRTMVLKEGFRLAAVGAACGLVVAAWVGHALRNQLYEVGSTDVVSVAAAAAALTAAALLASWIPARRAARVDPIASLRES